MKWIVVLLCLSLTGCSVGMALSGKETKNLGTIQVGQSRDIVLLNLGQPAKTNQTEFGRVDVFELQRGNDPSVGRALFHGAMDLITWGGWELVGTPMEGVQGKSFELIVHYDKEDKVTSVQTTDK